MSSKKEKSSKKKDKKDKEEPTAAAELAVDDVKGKSVERKKSAADGEGKRGNEEQLPAKESKEHEGEEEAVERRDEPAREIRKAQRATSNVLAIFNHTQIQEFKEAFTMIDQNRDGLIDTEDLQAIYQQIGTSPELSVLQQMVEESPGPLNFTTFLSLFGDKMKGCDTENTLRDAFSMFDDEGKGRLNAEFVKDLLMTVGDQFSKEEIKQVWKEAPIEGAWLDYLKFVKIIKRGKEE